MADAAQKARTTAITDAWLDYRMGRVGRHFDSEEAIEKLVRADERAKLAATVPPMTMTAEQEAADRKPLTAFLMHELSLSRSWAETDALRAALAAEREALATIVKLARAAEPHVRHTAACDKDELCLCGALKAGVELGHALLAMEKKP